MKMCENKLNGHCCGKCCGKAVNICQNGNNIYCAYCGERLKENQVDKRWSYLFRQEEKR